MRHSKFEPMENEGLESRTWWKVGPVCFGMGCDQIGKAESGKEWREFTL